MTFSSKALVLSRTEFGEADRYVTLFTPKWGLISALAKSARKSRRRYIGGLDLFCHNEVLLRGDPKEKPYLIELTVLNPFVRIRENLEKMLLAGQITQWVRRLVSHATAMPDTYSLLGQIFSLIEQEEDLNRLEILGLVFKVKFISQLGLKPSIDMCVRCGSTQGERSLFDIAGGGMVCRRCLGIKVPEESFALEQEEQRFLSQVDRFRLTQWKSLQYPLGKTRSLTHLVTQFASYHGHAKLPI